ncbi:hypothetical protein EB810_13190 [Altererythrobacter sp. FM1]|uniref:SIR2 family protein n=1 Tax=Tsuneonella flava TaxID=2055955 RepID=UPI000C7FB102|nr:SIR2 family protein [Tsuneonella flava]ROT94034.1 hypothetical protein EB810_13190 [Altererythrobacter sp. FM1]
MIEPDTRLAFSVVENPGVYALLIGSGVSRSAQIPTGWDITLDLVRRLAAAEGVTDERDWAAWYRSRFKADPGYSSLLDSLSLTAAERRSVLHHYIEPTAEDLKEERRVPTPAHHAIARLVRDGFIRVLITTNFDRLIEGALVAVGVEPVVISSVDDLAGASPLTHNRCTLIKLHGDYLDNRIRNIDDELGSYPAEFDALLDRIFDEHGLVVAGWSGEWDPALRAALTRAPNRRYPLWWAMHGEPSSATSDVVALKAAGTIPIEDADRFFVNLAAAVETLAAARRPSPDTIELLLATTKRNLSGPQYRIALADTITDQTQRVVAHLVDGELATIDGQPTWDRLMERWRTMESMGEPLARVAGLAGRWGSGSEFPLLEDALRELMARAPQTGNSALVGVSTYPAYLILLSYALGLAKAGRWEELHRWLDLKIARRDREPRDAMFSLFMSYWDGVEAEWWKHWPGMERRKTAWADHLVEVVVPWQRDFGLMETAALENYHMVELLGGFVALEGQSAEDLAKLSEFTWMPFGQTMWNGSARERTLAKLEAPGLFDDLLAAGFSNGSKDHWNGVKRNIDLLARRVGF